LQPALRSLSGDAAKQRLAELSQPLTPEAMEQDASAYIGFLASQDCVRQGAMGVVGYCLTGKMALFTAAVLPDKIAAASSFHGGGLFTDAPTSPHLALPRIQARLYFGHATNDRSMPEEAIAKLDRALEAWGENLRVNCIRMRITVGRPPTAPSTTLVRPSALFRS
jgi:carboxymethylenebutenolidase